MTTTSSSSLSSSTAMDENILVQRSTFPKNEESIKHYCRVCTANAKSKKRPDEHNVGIFKKIGLKSILEKFLHLELSEDDPLPKTICKKCFDKLMAVEFLQVVAKRSEQLFRDVLANRCHAVISIDDSYKTTSNIIPPPRKLDNKPEEVVVDVTMSDPLTKDIKKKLQVAQSKRDSIGLAFSPEHLNQNAVTSSPIPQVPVTIVHRMPKKRKTIPIPIESNKDVVQNPPVPVALHSNTTTVTLEHPPKKKFTQQLAKTNTSPPLRHISEAPAIPQNVEIRPVTSGNPTAAHGMPLGSIIKDLDLLILILKALKWPYNNQTLDIQIQRLKNTNFNDIIVDPNLLQDTDLIKILGPLLNPVPVTMRQQTYHITVPPESLDVPPTTMSYKLPAETSVQIITVPPTSAAETETEPTHDREKRHDRSYKRHMKHSVIRKKYNDYHNQPPVIVLSDSDDDERPMMKNTSNDEIQLDPAVYPRVDENSNSNEEMLATLNRQREAMMRMHRSKRKQSLSSAKNVEMVDDIMIVDEGYHMDEEPFPDVVLVKKNHRGSHDASSVHLKQAKPVKRESTSAAVGRNAYPLSVMKVPSRTYSCSNRGKASSSPRNFVKTNDDSALPPQKKVMGPSTTPSYVQVKETNQKVGYTSKNTTVADADSTTKIVTKDSKVPKSAKPTLSFEGKFSKATNSAQMSPSGNQSASSGKQQLEEEPGVVSQLEEKRVYNEKQKRTKPKKKNEYRLLGTFNISDDDEREQVRVAEEPTTEEQQQVNITVEEEGEVSAKITTEPVAEPSSVVDESPIQMSNVSKETDPLGESVEQIKEPENIELPSVDIKSEEEEEEINIKKEELDSAAEESPVAKTNEGRKSQRNFVASKTTIKTEFAKSTRSASKRKVIKEEEPSMEITNLRPARRSKTLSKYYKGPPLSGTEGRSMRTRT